MFEGKKIVIFGAHPDDIELGMGGTLNQIKDENVQIIVFADTVQYNGKEIISEFKKSMDSLNVKHVLLHYQVDSLAKDLVEIRKIIYEWNV